MSLKEKAFAAGRWTAASAAIRVCLQLLQTFVLARLLLPADFGLMAVASSMIAVAWLFADMGISRVLVHYDDVPSEALSSLYWLNIAMGLTLMALLWAVAPLLGKLYASHGLVPLLQWSSLVFPLTAYGQQYRVLAEKHLRFGALALNEIVSTLLGFVVAIAVAVGGGGVYALVAALLTTAAASSLMARLRLTDGWRPALRLHLKEARPYLRLGGYFAGGDLVNNLRMQADVFVGGLVASPTEMGIYSVPRNLSLRLAMIVNPIITRVGFPVMSRTRHDPVVLKAIYLQTLRMTASVNFPMYIALAVFADELVAVLYGSNFRGSGTYLRILALWGLLRSTGNPVGSLLSAVGHAGRAFWWNLVLLVLSLPLLWLGAQSGGLSGLAWTMLALQTSLFLPTWLWLVRPACNARFDEYSRSISAPMVSAVVAGLVAYGATREIQIVLPRLFVGLCVGGVAYALMSLWLNRAWIDAMRELMGLRSGLRRD